MLSFARVRALAILAVLIASAVVSVTIALGRDTEQVVAEDCPAGWPLANLTLREEKDVKVNVYNGTGQRGLDGRVAENFANRDFEVIDYGEDPEEAEVEGVALLRFGPAGVGSAQLLKAYFLDNAQVDIRNDREDDVVDVVLGAQFQQLATPTEVRQAIAAIGSPAAPEQTCPVWD